MGYEEMIYATSTGAITSDNLLQYLDDGEPLETVCAAAAAGGESLASLFASAATKNVLEIQTLEASVRPFNELLLRVGRLLGRLVGLVANELAGRIRRDIPEVRS